MIERLILLRSWHLILKWLFRVLVHSLTVNRATSFIASNTSNILIYLVRDAWFLRDDLSLMNLDFNSVSKKHGFEVDRRRYIVLWQSCVSPYLQVAAVCRDTSNPSRGPWCRRARRRSTSPEVLPEDKQEIQFIAKIQIIEKVFCLLLLICCMLIWWNEWKWEASNVICRWKNSTGKWRYTRFPQTLGSYFLKLNDWLIRLLYTCEQTFSTNWSKWSYSQK